MVIGPQAGHFRINNGHPLSRDLAMLLYAPAGYVDLVTPSRALTLNNKLPVQGGSRGLYFPKSGTGAVSVSLSPSVSLDATKGWCVAGLTDFTSSMQAYSSFAKNGAHHFTLNNSTAQTLAVWRSSASVYTGAVNGTGYRPHSVNVGSTYGDGYGALDGDDTGLTVTPDFATNTVTATLGDEVTSGRAWNDCVFQAIWNRTLTRAEHGLLGKTESGFLWDLLYVRPRRSIFIPAAAPAGGAVGGVLWSSIFRPGRRVAA